MTRAVLAALALCAALALPAAAPAVVPPKDCGMMTVKAKRYQIKADQISCETGRNHSRRYLSRHRRPSGYTCKDLSREKGRVNVTCSNGRKNFLAIRR